MSEKLPSNLRLESASKYSPSSSCKIRYGAPPNVHKSQTCENRRKDIKGYQVSSVFKHCTNN